MTVDEFKDLLSGLGPDTALGRIVQIRSENDTERLKQFSLEQRQIRNDWLQKQALLKDKKEVEDATEAIKNAFLALAGLGGED